MDNKEYKQLVKDMKMLVEDFPTDFLGREYLELLNRFRRDAHFLSLFNAARRILSDELPESEQQRILTRFTDDKMPKEADRFYKRLELETDDDLDWIEDAVSDFASYLFLSNKPFQNLFTIQKEIDRKIFSKVVTDPVEFTLMPLGLYYKIMAENPYEGFLNDQENDEFTEETEAKLDEAADAYSHALWWDMTDSDVLINFADCLAEMFGLESACEFVLQILPSITEPESIVDVLIFLSYLFDLLGKTESAANSLFFADSFFNDPRSKAALYDLCARKHKVFYPPSLEKMEAFLKNDLEYEGIGLATLQTCQEILSERDLSQPMSPLEEDAAAYLLSFDFPLAPEDDEEILEEENKKGKVVYWDPKNSH